MTGAALLMWMAEEDDENISGLQSVQICQRYWRLCGRYWSSIRIRLLLYLNWLSHNIINP